MFCDFHVRTFGLLHMPGQAENGSKTATRALTGWAQRGGCTGACPRIALALDRPLAEPADFPH